MICRLTAVEERKSQFFACTERVRVRTFVYWPGVEAVSEGFLFASTICAHPVLECPLCVDIALRPSENAYFLPVRDTVDIADGIGYLHPRI